MKSKKRFEILLCQYHECLSFIMMYSSAMWQLVPITMALNSFLAITYLAYAKTFESRFAVLLVSLSFILLLAMQLQKHRFFQEAMNADFEWIQTELRNLLPKGDNIREITLRTKDIWYDEKRYSDVHRTWLSRQGAYKWFMRSLYVTMFVICLLLFCEAVGFLTSIIN